jgi:exosortase
MMHRTVAPTAPTLDGRPLAVAPIPRSLFARWGFFASPRSWQTNGWARWHLALLVLLVFAGVLATLEGWRDIYEIATKDQESSHIFLVPFVTGWLIWVRRGRFRSCRAHGRLIGPVLIAIGWVCYSLGDLRLIQVIWHAGAILVVLGCIFTVLGIDVFFAFLPAIVLQIFMIPVPGRVRQAIAIPLENWTTIATQNVCAFVGLLSERSGNVLTINGRDVEIAEACNGLRGVFALTLVSFAFAFGTPLRWYVRAAVLVGSPLCAIFCNVVRLVPTVWVFGYYSNSFAEAFHDVSGWLMLPIAFLILMGIIRLLRWALVPVTVFTLAYD